jgi:hypothetical protein
VVPRSPQENFNRGLSPWLAQGWHWGVFRREVVGAQGMGREEGEGEDRRASITITGSCRQGGSKGWRDGVMACVCVRVRVCVCAALGGCALDLGEVAGGGRERRAGAAHAACSARGKMGALDAPSFLLLSAPPCSVREPGAGREAPRPLRLRIGVLFTPAPRSRAVRVSSALHFLYTYIIHLTGLHFTQLHSQNE